jgi:PAN domain
MLRPVFMALTLCCIALGTAKGQPSPVGDTGAKTLHPVPQGLFRIDSDGQAKAIIDEILRRIVGITATDWDVWITADKNDTPYAVARYVPQPNLKREIIFNEQFLKKITEVAGKWPAYCVAAHEIGHLFRLHLENRAIKIHDAELEADYYCGFVLGKMGSDYDQAIAAIQWIASSPNYPTRDERIAQIGRGWTEATGQLASNRASQPMGQSPEQPAIDLVKEAQVSSKFGIRSNRDIPGHDLAVTGGRPGIPGIDINQCAARCNDSTSCKAYSFDRWNGWCFLKDQIASTLLDPRSTIGVKRPLTVPPVSRTLRAEMQGTLRGKRFRDEAIARVSAANFQGCEKSCADDLRCVAFSFLKTVKNGENCEKFKYSDGYYHDESADSGYKQQNP